MIPFPPLPPYPQTQTSPSSVYVPFALLSFLASTLGDLYNSKCKRLANVKDTGTTMGAFGGVWDRMDSVMGNSLVVAAYLTIK